MENKINFITNIECIEEDEAEAAIALNGSLSFAKFIFTSAEKNKNKQRVPEDEFDNIVKTGTFMPFKMAEGAVSDGHAGARPIGVITHMIKDNGLVKGIAGLWKKENKKEIEVLKEMIAAGKTPQVSWELNYNNSTIDEEGVENLHGIVVRAATVVGMPAYAGMTPILALASEDIDSLPDSSFLYIEDGGELDGEEKTSPRSLRHFPYKNAEGQINQERLSEAMSQIDTLVLKDGSTISEAVAEQIKNQSIPISEEKIVEEIESLKTKIEELTSAVAERDAKIESLVAEKEELAQFKSKIEEEKAAEEKLASIKSKFSEAKLEKSAEYFEEKKETLLKMSEEELDFMIQEITSFSPKEKQASEDMLIPNLKGESNKIDAVALGKALRESSKK